MLCIVRRQGHRVSAYAASYCFSLEVYRAVVVKYGLALASNGDIVKPYDIHLLLRCIVKSCGDGTLSL